ncbi:MAG: amino acid permease [bacterium]|nr:amino acid permease [Candidatus Kapabacteria bacterium]
MTTDNRNEDLSSEIKRVNRGLLPALGLFTTTMLIVGAMIGSGIFRKPGTMAADLIDHGVGMPELLIGVWILAGLITLFGALTNAEIASMIPETGGQYVYFNRMYGPFAAYLYGWAVFIVIQTGSIAGIAYIFAEYCGHYVSLPQLSESVSAISFTLPIGTFRPFADFGMKSIAAGLIITLTIVNYLGVRFGGAVQNFFTLSKVAAIVTLVVLTFVAPEVGSATNFVADSRAHGPSAGALALALGIAAALQGAFWAYDGWNSITYIAGEVRRPRTTIPRALVSGLAIVIAIYVLTNLAYIYVLPIDAMAGSKLVASDVADRIVAGGGALIAAAVMVSTFGTVNGTILASARVYFSMARHNVFPRFLGHAHPRFHTPGSSLIVQCVWSVVLLFSGTFDSLTDTLIFVSWIFYAAGAYGLFVLRRRYPNAERPYRVPGYPWVPAIFIVFAVVFLCLTVYNDVAKFIAARATGEPAVINSAFGLTLVAIGIPLYYYFRRAAKRNPNDESGLAGDGDRNERQ